MSFAPSQGWGSGSARPCARPPGRAVEIVGLVFLFIYFWPLAVAYLGWKLVGYPLPNGLPRMFDRVLDGPFRRARTWSPSFGGTGNLAFDEYRMAEIRRLEEERRRLDDEARTFRTFVEDLKRAKDREEFDAYMAKRRAGSATPV